MARTAREEAETRIRELALKAHSRGPWTAESLDDEPTVNWTFDIEGYGLGYGPLAWCNHPEDALYIAAVSPEAVLALLDEVATLRALSVPETDNWEYAMRAPNGRMYVPVLREDEVEGSTLYRRRPPGPWEPCSRRGRRDKELGE